MGYCEGLMAFRAIDPVLDKLQQESPKLILMLGDPDQWGTVDLKFRKMEIKGLEVLLDFLLTDADDKNIERRAHAAGIISNTADIRFLDKLFHLLEHPGLKLLEKCVRFCDFRSQRVGRPDGSLQPCP